MTQGSGNVSVHDNLIEGTWPTTTGRACAC